MKQFFLFQKECVNSLQKAKTNLFLVLFFAMGLCGNAQLISPTGDGGFENGATFAANGWTAVNTATAGGSQWFLTSSTVTNGSYSFVPTTSRAAFISNNTGTNWRYNTTPVAASSHIYKDITFPATQTTINLSFRYNVGPGEATYDEMYVYLCPQTLAPVANSPSSSSSTVTWTGTGTATLLGTFRNLAAGAGASSGNISISSAVAGNTVASSNMRLVFTWKNDGGGGSEPPAALDDVSLTSFTPVPFSGTRTVGPTGDYASLGAAFTALSGNGVNGAVTLELQSTYVSSVETFPIVAAAILGSSNTNSITVRPATGATGLSITSANATATLSLSGGSNITIDGRPGGTGALAATNLTIANTSTAAGGTAVEFLNDAVSNTVQYCNLSAAFASTTSGVVNILGGTTNVTGNDNNTITFNNINGTGAAANGIYSLGTTNTNNGITISNNNIYDFFAAGIATNGISVAGFNTDWTISGNRIYQTVARTFTTGATQTGIIINSGSGNNFSVTTNIIGGSSAGAVLTGGPTALASYTIAGNIANRYRGISMNVAGITASSVQGNTIAGFTCATSSGAVTIGGPWCGIYVNAGNVNIGNTTGNTIGSGTGTGSIVITPNNNGAVSYGIFVDGTSGTLNISNNVIGSITTASSAVSNSHGFTGISIASTAAVTISSNVIGSTTTANSINAITAATGTNPQPVTGILNSGASSNIQITNNTIANLNNAYVPTAAHTAFTIVRGIVSSSGVNTITGNTVRNLSTAANATGTTSAASVIGISLTSSTSGTTDLSQNTIFSLTNSHATAAALVTGIFTSGITTGTVGRNLIYDLDAGNATATLSGIHIGGGTATYQNNMVRLGTAGTSNTVSMNINGILELLGTNNVYHNTIHVGGAPTSGANPSFAFNSQQTTNARNFRNNIFSNARSNGLATGKHYAVRVAGTGVNPTGLTINYNIYRATGTGAVFGFYNADVTNLAAWQTAVGQDVNSLTIDPCLANPSAAIPNLKLTNCSGAGSPADGSGVLIASVTDDNEGDLRTSNSPADIGADAGIYTSSGIDMAATLLVAPTALGCKTATEAVTVRITNFSSASIDFAVNPATVAATATGGYSSTIVVNTGTLAAGATRDVTLPATIDLTASGSYTFNANTSVTGDVAAGNNAMGATVLNISSLIGTYTVGSGGTYPTITAAVAAYNGASCITGPVVFSLTDTTYGVSETFPIVINGNANAGTNSLTIRPATGVTATISGSLSSNALIRLNGADFVNIDGSNSGGSDRSLTIANTATTAPSGISIISLGTGLGAINNTVKNCNISTGVQTTLGYGIAVGGSTPGTSGADNDNTTIQNNNMTACAVGVYAIGTAAVASGGVDNLNITGNTIDYNGAVANAIAIRVGNTLNSSISQNTIDVETSGSSAAGIALETGANNTVVSRNLIRKVKGTNSSTGSYRGIVVGTAQTGSAITLSNNMIYNVIANWPSSTSGFNHAGIVIGAIGTSTTMSTITGGVNLYFNSVNIYGNSDRLLASTLSMAVHFGSAVSSIDVRNNIFANSSVNINAGGTTHKSYAIYSQAANTAFTAINNNDYFVSGTQGVLGFLTSDRIDLAGIVSGFGTNGTSLNVNPLFNSNTNLQPGLGSTVVNAGTPIGGITIDIANVTRNIATPTIGAFETAADSAGPAITFSALSTGTASNRTTTAFATITDPSAVNTTTTTAPRLYYKKSTDANTYVDNESSTNGWKWVEAIGATSPFDFTIDYSKINGGSVVATNTIQYFVVAQDLLPTPNVSISNSLGFTIIPTTVNLTSASFPITGTPNSYNIAASLSGTVNIPGTYPTLTGAGGLFAAVNAGVVTGNITVNITADLTEDGTNSLNEWIESPAASNFTMTIQPNAATIRTISGNVVTGMIRLNGADRVTIDGRFSGAGQFLNFINTNTPAATGAVFTFVNGATNNTLKNLFMQSITGSTTGCVFFSTTTGGGNSNNTIDGCKIRAYNGTNFGNVAIYSSGTVGNENSANTISNNEIYSYAFRGIDITSTGSTGWTITGNSFYNEVTPADYSTGSLQGIRAQGGGNYTITGNLIGTNAPLAAGSNSTFFSSTVVITYTGISLSATSGTSNIRGNVIRGVNVNCVPTAVSTIFNGISVSGAGITNIGGAGVGEGNTIGSNNANSNFILTTTTTSTSNTTQANGIVSSGAGNLIRGNQIGGIDINNLGASPAPTTFFGIVSTGTATVPPMLITDNTVGSSGVGAATNSIRFLSASLSIATGIIGITHQVATNAVSITNNTVRNITNQSTTSSGIFNGLFVSNAITNPVIITGNTIDSIGSVTNTNGTSFVAINTANVTSTLNVSNNTITNITQASTGTSSTITGVSHNGTAVATISQNTINNFSCAGANTTLTAGVSSVQGIYLIGASLTAGSLISQNTISNLSNTNTGAVGTNVSGIGFAASLSPTITRNRIFGLSNLSTGTTVTAPPTVSGIIMRSTATTANVSNNMISLGEAQTTNTQFIGLWNNFDTAGIFNIFYNSINISGTANAGALPSYSIQRGDNSTVALSSPVVIRNNILRNERAGGTGKHYAIANQSSTANTSGWTASFITTNAVRTASAATVGLWGATDLTFDAWKTNAGGDASNINPLAVNFVDTSVGNLDLVTSTNCALNGSATVLSVTTDFSGAPRNATTPDIGAFEFDQVLPTITLGTSPTVCAGATTANLPYSATTASPDKVTIDYDAAANTAGFVDVTLANLTTTPIVLTVPGAAAAATYNATLTVSNSTSGCVSAVQNITVTIIAPDTWIGATSTEWNVASNWSCGLVPVPASNVVIATSANNPEISSDLVINTLTVNVGANLKVNSNFDLTVTGAITNNGAVTFENNANLLQGAAAVNVGNVVIKRNTSMQRLAYTYWSSPVAAQNALAFSPLTTLTRFYTYDEPTNTFATIASPVATNLAVGVGYGIRAPNTFADAPATAQTFIGTFTGVPNNGDYSVAVTKDAAGYNLVGNPYPSTILASAVFAANPNVSALYFWDNANLGTAGNRYATRNTLTGIASAVSPAKLPSNFIGVGQGFFVLVNAATSVVFNNGMRSSENNPEFFRNATTDKSLFKLNLLNATSMFNQIAIGYTAGATNGIDNQIDAAPFAPSATMVSSLINNVDYVIQGRALPFANTDVVPLGFKTDVAGSYSFTSEAFEGVFANNQNIFLKDNLAGITHNIKQSAYQFTSNVGIFNNRFEIVYQSTLGIENPNLDANNVFAFLKNDLINIKSTINITDIKVYDVSGRLVYEKSKINTQAIELNDLKTEHQMLLIQITADGKTVTKKIVY